MAHGNDHGLSRSQKLALKQIDNDLKAALGHDPSRRMIMRLIDSAGVFQRTFTGNSETFFREGRRSVGLDLIDAMERVDPGVFAKMQAEALALRQRQDFSQSDVKEEHDE